MKRNILLMVITLIASTAMLFGSGTVGGGVKSDMKVKKNLKGTITKLDLDERIVLLKTNDEKVYQFNVGDKTKLKAHKKSALAARKDLSLSDFVEGQTVQITYDPATPQAALELRLLPTEMTSKS